MLLHPRRRRSREEEAMIDATHVPQQERERPDLYVRLFMDEHSPIEENAFGTSWALSTMPEDASREWFRLPGNRREKLQAELMRALKELVNADDARQASGGKLWVEVTAQAVADVKRCYSALAELDAKEQR